MVDMIVRRWVDPSTLRDRIEAENVQPEQGFHMDLLAQADGEILAYDGQTITLSVDNGRWVWQVVEVDRVNRIVHGRWPD